MQWAELLREDCGVFALRERAQDDLDHVNRMSHRESVIIGPNPVNTVSSSCFLSLPSLTLCRSLIHCISSFLVSSGTISLRVPKTPELLEGLLG